ncbi:mitochondrial inner membrane protein Mpv17 [Rhipicephalus microplus]|uniref:mitochondrial inner membrane protein Mpv17 n=1 Tax=Rhipicephalus microplus TaxID=6941 RepID=UPI003F6D8CE8
MRQAWSLYTRVMHDHPVKTQLITTATVMLSGDLIAQKVLERRTDIDVPRAARFFVMGVAFVGPALRVWYLALERIIGSGGGRAMVIKKVFLDQAVFTPVFLPSFLVTLGALQQRSWDSIKDTLRADYLPILKANYMLWPAAQLINFSLVPLNYRVPFASCVALVWNTYLAWKANRMQLA